jgi:hypothetical protein
MNNLARTLILIVLIIVFWLCYWHFRDILAA